jgi:hypothetical protein
MADMVAGNPKANRTGLCMALAVLFLILLSAAFVALRKREAPQKEPPLHPAGLLVTDTEDTPATWVPARSRSGGGSFLDDAAAECSQAIERVI